MITHFPQTVLTSQVPYNRYNSPSDSLVPGFRPHSIRNIELRILDYFACVLAYDLGYFELVSSIRANVSDTLKQA